MNLSRPTCASIQETSTDAHGFPPLEVFLVRARTPSIKIKTQNTLLLLFPQEVNT